MMRNLFKNGHPNRSQFFGCLWGRFWGHFWVDFWDEIQKKMDTLTDTYGPLIVWHEFGFWSYLALSWTWSWRIASRRITDRICVRSLSVSCCSSRSGNKWPPPDWNGKRKSRLKNPYVLWMNWQISSCTYYKSDNCS